MKKPIRLNLARGVFMVCSIVVFLVPIVLSKVERGNLPLLAEIFSGPAGVHALAQASEFPAAVYAGAASALICALVAATLLSASDGFFQRLRSSSTHQTLGQRLLAAILAALVIPGFWIWPYSKGAGSWSAPISIWIAESPVILGLFFAGVYIVCVGSLVFIFALFSRGGDQ